MLLMLKRILPLVLLFCSPFKGFSQDKDPSIESLLDQALVLKINAKLLTTQSNTSWNFNVARLTIPGRPVVLKLQGNNLQVIIGLTPYRDDPAADFVVLVIQGEVWITETPGKQAKYLASLKTITVTMGEKINLYPLGVSASDEKKYNIELEIQVIPYRDMQKKNQTEEKSDTSEDKPKAN